MMEWEKRKVARELDARDNLIDYLLKDYGGDCCAKCVYCKEDSEEDLPPCEMLNEFGNLGCKQGMLEWFRNNQNEGN